MLHIKVSAAGTSILLSGLFLYIIISCGTDISQRKKHEIRNSGIDSLYSQSEYFAGSNTKLSIIYLEKARSLIDEHKYPDDYARYHLVKGRIYYYQDDYIASISHLDTAITIYSKTENLKKLAKAYFFMESTQGLVGNYPAAIQSGLESIKISTRIDIIVP